MTRSKRLQPVAEVTRHRERDAAKRLGRSQQSLNEQQERLQELKGFREQYQHRYQEALVGNRLAAASIQEYQAFLQRLDQAIQQQQQMVTAGARDYETCRRQWLESRCRAGAIDKVVERHRTQERQQRERNEQFETDDRAQRASRED